MPMANQGGGNSVLRNYRKGNWTVEETMVLIEAKKMDGERRMKRSIGGESSEGIIKIICSSSTKPAELRWKWVEGYCWRNGCLRSQNQCNDKWDNLMRDFKKVRDYQRRRSSLSSSGAGDDHGRGSYWKMEKHERKERNLPSNMLPDIYQALMEVVERKESVSPRTLALPGPAGGGDGSGGYVVVERSTPLAVLPLPSLPLPPSPPLLPPLLPLPAAAAPLQPLRHSNQPLPTVDSGDTSEHADSPAAKKRRRGSGEDTSCGIHPSGTTPPPPPSHDQVIDSAISRSASIIAEAIQACEERKDRRHRDLLSLQERRLHIEESKTEITRQGFNCLVDAINKLANSILALANSNHHQTTTTPR
ncbi:Trihelix transcription factor [Actinidia chinensis var. chinensis]|uniref:Trihelix transcription factor n=1 Tax=Actinidia chinensis var. chinensis TaxID=1590841 RepID=A0A2R6Q5I6_ACTCC|nr:Trihelix transcription factor [Actinidia chinensis var. chinensis]